MSADRLICCSAPPTSRLREETIKQTRSTAEAPRPRSLFLLREEDGRKEQTSQTGQFQASSHDHFFDLNMDRMMGSEAFWFGSIGKEWRVVNTDEIKLSPISAGTFLDWFLLA